MERLEQHPLAVAVPAMTDEEYVALKSDMEESGFDPRFPVVTAEDDTGRVGVLDGWHRYRAAGELGIEPVYLAWRPSRPGDTQARFVLRASRRRNLTAGQRAALAAALLPEIRKEADARKRSGTKRTSENHTDESSVRSDRDSRLSTAVAARAVGASENAVRVAAKAEPEVRARLAAGTITVAQAAREARAPEPDAGDYGLDAAMRPVREARVADAMRLGERFAELRKSLAAVLAETKRLAADEAGRYLNVAQVQAGIDNARLALFNARPHAGCPRGPGCKKTCELCEGAGWLNKVRWDNLPKDLRA